MSKYCSNCRFLLPSHLNVTVVCVRFFLPEKKNPPSLHPESCRVVNSSGYDEILTPPLFSSPEIQTKSSGVHPSPERTGNIVTDQSHRVSHGGNVCGVECPAHIRFKTFQTHGNADVDINHLRPPSSSPNCVVLEKR